MVVVVVMESRVSHMYQEKVYERRGGEDITYANCVPGTMTVLNGFESANDMSARFCSSPIKPYPFETVSMISYLLTIILQQLQHAYLKTLKRRRKLQSKLMILRKYVMLDQNQAFYNIIVKSRRSINKLYYIQFTSES